MAKDDILKWLKVGIDTEERGIVYYTECRHKVRNQQGIELFDFLVKAENGHKKVLTDLYDAVSKSEFEIIKKTVSDFMKLDIHTPLFDKESLERLTKSTARLTEMFNTAIEMETVGIRFYSDLAMKEKDADVKKLLKRLADDEKNHRKDLVNLGHFVFGLFVNSDYGEDVEEAGG